MKVIALSGAGVLLVAVLAVFMASGIFSKAHYLEPWQQTYSNKFDDPRIKLASYGLLAANGHNMQPWKIKLDADKDSFYLYADNARLVKEVDPFSRQTMVAQGTFLEYVRVGGEQIGYKAAITLFPDGEYDEQNLAASMKNKPVAKITLTKAEPQRSLLYEQMFLPDTNRCAYQKQALTSEEVKQLLAINDDRDLEIKLFQDEGNIKKLGRYVMEGAKIEAGIHRINEESGKVFRTNEGEKNKYRYGFSVDGQGMTGIKKHLIQGLLTLFPSMNNEKNAADLYVKSVQTAVDNTPAYGLIITKGNSRVEQVKSGMLYSRLVLQAHALGLAMHPPSQVLQEYSEMEAQYNQIHHDYAPSHAAIQMLFRIGKPTQEFPQSMRRDIMDLIEG